MKLSVIIPTLNEERGILQMMRSLQSQKTSYPVEWIVVDGGSQDETVRLAQSTGAKVISAERGRAKQMNAGASRASGEVLLFLHSDSALESDCLEELGKAMGQKDIVGGCFQLAFSDANFSLQLIAWASNLRAKWLKMMFGDQGVFVRREVFDRVGGFPDIELMEDLEFSRRIKHVGKLINVKKRIFSSPRRFQHGGIWRTVWLMQKLKWMYWRGIPPSVLRTYYEDRR